MPREEAHEGAAPGIQARQSGSPLERPSSFFKTSQGRNQLHSGTYIHTHMPSYIHTCLWSRVEFIPERTSFARPCPSGQLRACSALVGLSLLPWTQRPPPLQMVKMVGKHTGARFCSLKSTVGPRVKAVPWALPTRPPRLRNQNVNDRYNQS